MVFGGKIRHVNDLNMLNDANLDIFLLFFYFLAWFCQHRLHSLSSLVMAPHPRCLFQMKVYTSAIKQNQISLV